jgi:hypothetical protein
LQLRDTGHVGAERGHGLLVEAHEVEEEVGRFRRGNDRVVIAGGEELEFLELDPASWFKMPMPIS